LESHPRRLAVLGIGDREIRQMDRGFLRDDPRFLLGGLFLVTLHSVDPAHDRAFLFWPDLQDVSRTALVASGEDNDPIAFFYFCGHHNTSGASEMIFIWFLARNSRGTGPKMRVPTGSDWLLIKTAAFESNLMTEPSARLMSLAVRTTTAFITSPFLTRPRGIASLIETTIMSPTPAYFRFEPPSTLMHITRRAPELSATSRLVCICIITYSPLLSPVRAAQAFGAVSPTTIQRLSFEIGRVSSIDTVSPTFWVLFSTCAW